MTSLPSNDHRANIFLCLFHLVILPTPLLPVLLLPHWLSTMKHRYFNISKVSCRVVSNTPLLCVKSVSLLCCPCHIHERRSVSGHHKLNTAVFSSITVPFLLLGISSFQTSKSFIFLCIHFFPLIIFSRGPSFTMLIRIHLLTLYHTITQCLHSCPQIFLFPESNKSKSSLF